MAYPVVITQCWSGLVPLKPDAKLYYNLNGTEMPPDLSELAKYSTLGDIAEELSSSSERLGNVQLYAPVWLPSPWPASPSLFAVFISHEIGESGNASQSLSWYLKERDQFSRRSTVTVTACTLSAFWEFGEVQLQQTSTEETVKTMSYPKFLTQEARPVTLNVTHIDTIRRAGFHRQLLEAVPSLAGDGQHPFERSHMPFSLGAIFALGISKIPAMEKHYSANASLFEQGELVWFPPPGVDPANTTMFKFTLTDYGYGYGTRSTSVYLAMTVISIYCVITIIYISYTIITGFSVTAWNSGIELVMLALQSKRPDYLGHTSVGIDSIKTFGESVGIRVNADDELELVFAHDRDFEKRGLRKIERNKEY
ncbi:hypothetical protein HBI95_049920 [Parastagonospora nodorum]|nr:hypothetical protein HBH43_221720 [Parastagonospora nodorum]KAH4212124.1 hypothetical protein HBI95_049920 [Parastagonospora nodorum]KAH4800044.1 hypothetical protein HBH61_217430 [Parastagonospora nodorum]KAH4918658.1 hypothetical protein HBI79_209100 [Parastagonospora nodorum]KAH5725886.1 hypothetical protein HBI17_239310 [Parastagonospora nodorum]